MNKTKLQSDANRALAILSNMTAPIRAIDLAERLGLAGGKSKRESKRGRIRMIISYLRNQGHWIVANLQDGYWITGDPKTWNEYLSTQIFATKKRLGQTHKMQADTTGQGVFFDGGKS